MADEDPEAERGTPVALGGVYRAVWEISLDGEGWCEVPEYFVACFAKEIEAGHIKARRRWP